MKCRQRRQLGLEPIDDLLEPLDVLVARDRLGDARGDALGGIGELGAEREQIALTCDEQHRRDRDRALTARPKPSQAFSSSTSP